MRGPFFFSEYTILLHFFEESCTKVVVLLNRRHSKTNQRRDFRFAPRGLSRTVTICLSDVVVI